MRNAAWLVVLVCLALALPLFGDQPAAPTVPGDAAGSIVKSIGSAGTEAAARVLAGVLYDSSCKGGNPDIVTGYTCKILGSVSGRDEQAWKDNIKKQLEAISSQLHAIDRVQSQIREELHKNYSVLSTKVDQVAANVIAVDKLVRVDGLWEQYEAQFEGLGRNVEPDSMVSFAKLILSKEPHTALTDLNVLLTNPPTGQPLVRYPFYEWRTENEKVMPGRLNANEIYDFAERKFLDYRIREQKAYLMYVWAAAVLDSQCQLHPDRCTHLPRPIKDFEADYDRYTRQQAAAFNAAVDWFLLSYGSARGPSRYFLPTTSQEVYLRANALTAAMVGTGEGLWGRVISMGNAWDGTLQVTCGGATQTLAPVLRYAVPVAGSGLYSTGPVKSGPVDWWVSSEGNDVYDEVHFSDNWQMYHYSLPSAAEGPCTVAEKLPRGGVMPWVQPDVRVISATLPDERKVRFGTFLAIQRAGGTYALVSGHWSGASQPFHLEEGKGQRENVVYRPLLLTDTTNGPELGVRAQGRSEYSMFRFSSRIHDQNRIDLTQSKTTRFPEGGTVKLHFTPGACGKEACESPNSILRYNVDPGGKLTARATVGFHDVAVSDIGSVQGVRISNSYDSAGDRKTFNAEGPQIGIIHADPNKHYQFGYSIYLDLETEGKGVSAAEYMYSVLLAPLVMYLSR